MDISETDFAALIGERTIQHLVTRHGVDTKVFGSTEQRTDMFADLDQREADKIRGVTAGALGRLSSQFADADILARTKRESDELALPEASGATPEEVAVVKSVYSRIGLSIDSLRAAEAAERAAKEAAALEAASTTSAPAVLR